MNNQLECEKVIEWHQNDTTYLLHITVQPELISIEAEDKHSGELWLSDFTNIVIQDLTSKAKNPKKYPVFVRMLLTALARSNQSLNAEILTYRQLSNRFGKPGAQQKNITPEQASKRFLILSYVSQFQKMQFPLPLGYQAQPSVDRLKMTVRRMGQQIQLLKEGQDEGTLARELSLLRYENESLKAKLKNNIKLQSSVFQPSRIEQLQKQISQKNNQINTLKSKIEQLNKNYSQSQKRCQETKQFCEKLQKILDQKQQILKKKDKKNRKQLQYEQKLQTLIKQMSQLAEQLQYAKQKQKKSQMKILTLQKQLQKMIAANKQSRFKETDINRKRVSSPDAQSAEKQMSIKSGKSNRSNKSGKSLTKGKTTQPNKQIYGTHNNYNLKRVSNHQKSSVYDSDTQSSRMRKMNNGRASPYRQGITTNNSQKKTPRKNDRSRSKSKQRVEAQKNTVAQDSQVFTEGEQSEDSSEEHIEKIDSYLKNLKQKKVGAKKVNKPSNQGSKIQNRLQTLEQMIKKAAQSTRTKF